MSVKKFPIHLIFYTKRTVRPEIFICITLYAEKNKPFKFYEKFSTFERGSKNRKFSTKKNYKERSTIKKK